MTDWKIAVFLVCAMISTAIGVAGLMALEDDFGEELAYEPETQFRDMYAALLPTKIRGMFPGVEDPKEDELFDSKRTVMSWNDDVVGQKIVVQGELTGDSSFHSSQFRYCYAIKTVGGVKLQADITQGPNKGAKMGDETEFGEYYNVVGFQVMEGLNADGCFAFEVEERFTGKAIPLNSKVTAIHGAGIPHGSVLRVQAEHWGRSWSWEDFRWEWGASDEALLLTGLGYITKDREANYQVGETALITVTIPYVKSISESTEGEGGFGFYLDAYHLGRDQFMTTEDGTTVNRLSITSTTQTFKIPIEPEYFTLGSMHNQIEFKLFNELYPKHAASTDIVDIRDKAPPKPNVKTDKTEYFEGETVTVTWECFPNPKTNLSIVMAKLVAWIGGVEVFRESFTGSNDEVTASFTAPISGSLDYRVSCIDSAGRGSGNDEMVIIHNVLQTDFCTANPTHPSCLPPPGDGFPLWEAIILTIAFIGAFLVVVVIAFLLNGFGVPTHITLLVAAVIFFILAAVIVVAGQGAIDAIANYQAVIT